MKKIALTAFAAMIFTFANGEAAELEISTEPATAEVQELGAWTHFRDKYLLGRDTDKSENKDRREHRPPPPPHHHHHHHYR